MIEKLREAAKIIRDGGIVVYPTETVYGIGADVFSERAVRRVYEVKRRPLDQPLSIAVCSYDMIEDIAYVGDEEMEFMRKFLPGPVTVLLPRRAKVCKLLAPSNLVGIRFPSHEIALKLIELCGPITSTSANISGKNAPVCVDEVSVNADLVIDGGRCKYGIESTIVDLTRWRIVRRGAMCEDVEREICKRRG